MTAGRHHVLEQGFVPKTNGVYTWWPVFVISGLAQASYTVQRIEAQTKPKNKKNTKEKKSIWQLVYLQQYLARSFFFLVSLFSFRKVSEILGDGWFFTNFRTLSIVSGLFSETELFAAPIGRASLKPM